MTEKALFNTFPKTRPPLPQNYQAIYHEHLYNNREGRSFASGLAARMEGWMHQQAARDVRNRRPGNGDATLELGAGALNHLKYEPLTSPYDIVEPLPRLYQSSPFLQRVRHVYTDITDVPAEYRYQRIISIAVLEHLEELPTVVARCALRLSAEGSFRVGIPNESSWCWRAGYRWTAGLEFRRRYHLDYETLVRHEHLNTADEIEDVLKYFFSRVECRLLGPTKRMACYRFYCCRNPRKKESRGLLAAYASRRMP